MLRADEERPYHALPKCKYGLRQLAHGGSPFAPARFLDCARNDGAKYRYTMLRADESVRPYHALPNVSTGIADMPTAARRRADEGTTTFLEPSPLGEGGTSESKANRVTNEGSGYDERNVKDNPSSVATRQLPPPRGSLERSAYEELFIRNVRALRKVFSGAKNP